MKWSGSLIFKILTVVESGSAVPEHLALVTARIFLFFYFVVKNVQW